MVDAYRQQKRASLCVAVYCKQNLLLGFNIVLIFCAVVQSLVVRLVLFKTDTLIT